MDELNKKVNDLLSIFTTNMTAFWEAERKMFRVDNPKGQVWKTMGQMIDGEMYIYPEEALYLCWKGTTLLSCCENDQSIISNDRLLDLAMEHWSFESIKIYLYLRSNGFVVWRPTYKYLHESLKSARDSVIYRQPTERIFQKNHPAHLEGAHFSSDPSKPVIGDIEESLLNPIIISFIDGSGISFYQCRDLTNLILLKKEEH